MNKLLRSLLIMLMLSSSLQCMIEQVIFKSEQQFSSDQIQASGNIGFTYGFITGFNLLSKKSIGSNMAQLICVADAYENILYRSQYIHPGYFTGTYIIGCGASAALMHVIPCIWESL